MSIDERFEEWWKENTSKGRIVMVSANEFLHMKEIAKEAFKEGHLTKDLKSYIIKDRNNSIGV